MTLKTQEPFCNPITPAHSSKQHKRVLNMHPVTWIWKHTQLHQSAGRFTNMQKISNHHFFLSNTVKIYHRRCICISPSNLERINGLDIFFLEKECIWIVFDMVWRQFWTLIVKEPTLLPNWPVHAFTFHHMTIMSYQHFRPCWKGQETLLPRCIHVSCTEHRLKAEFRRFMQEADHQQLVLWKLNCLQNSAFSADILTDTTNNSTKTTKYPT